MDIQDAIRQLQDSDDEAVKTLLEFLNKSKKDMMEVLEMQEQLSEMSAPVFLDSGKCRAIMSKIYVKNFIEPLFIII